MFLQQLLPNGTRLAFHDLQPDEMESWLETLPSAQPGEAARALVAQLAELRRTNLTVRSRLKLLELMRDKAESLLPGIQQRLDGASLPLPPTLQQAVIDGNSVLKALSLGYAMVADAISGKWSGLGFQKPLLLAVTQGLRLNGRRLELAYAVYARGSRSAWTELHRLYRLVRAAEAASMPAEGAEELPERVYVKALLLAFAEPTRFAPGDLDRVQFYLERYGHLAQLEPASTLQAAGERGAFLIREGATEAGFSLHRWRDGPWQPSDLVLRCDPLVKKLVGQIDGLERGIMPAKLGLPRNASQPEYLALLRELAKLWSAPPSRRHPRTHFRPRVDVVLGCTALRAFIAGPAFRRRTQDGPVSADAEGEMTEWTVTNESPDGFALRYVGGNTGEVRVGEILAIRPRGSSAMHIAIVRRATSTVASLEIGVQMLASRAAAATVNLPGEGGPQSAVQRQVQAIFLPRMPAFDNAPAILAPPGTIGYGIEFTMPCKGRNMLMRVARCIAKTPTCEVLVLEKQAAHNDEESEAAA
ncbi:MAG: hypothetical protein H6R11_2041 [Proteobacteria bacterium]|nr:hypothetical protein [Pseudomonadota bacterium]